MPNNTTSAAPKYDVKIHSIRPEGSCKATASVNVYGDFAVRGIKIMEGSKGLFISMPSYKAGNGEYKDICFPCTKEAKADFDQKVLAAYHQTMEQSQTQRQEPPARQEQSGQTMAGM